jgi:hypothetical protein
MKEKIIELWFSTRHGTEDHQIWLRDHYILWAAREFGVDISDDEMPLLEV